MNNTNFTINSGTSSDTAPSWEKLARLIDEFRDRPKLVYIEVGGPREFFRIKDEAVKPGFVVVLGPLGGGGVVSSDDLRKYAFTSLHLPTCKTGEAMMLLSRYLTPEGVLAVVVRAFPDVFGSSGKNGEADKT